MSDKTNPSETTGMQSVSLSAADATRCIKLSNEAGWNQTIADWQVMLKSGAAFGIESAGTLIATAVVLPYLPHVAWISMVIVTAKWRRNGLGSRLTERCIAACAGLGVTPFLDATEHGVPVYESLGFAGTETISRLVYANLRQNVLVNYHSDDDDFYPLQGWERIGKADRTAFGTQRTYVIRSLTERDDSISLHSRRGDSDNDMVTGRSGHNYYHIGPLLASSDSNAVDLVHAVMRSTSRSIVIDVPDTRPEFRKELESAGFEQERSFLRMHLGEDPGIASPRGYYAIAGPEYG